MEKVLKIFTVVALAAMVKCADKPNIVIIMADDMGSYDASFRGSNQFLTPNIDALGYHGVIFDRFYTPHLCTPSRSSLMTGKYPHNIGMQDFVIPGNEAWGLGLDENLMSNYFKNAGYKTHLVGKWHLGFYKKQHTPTYRGFDSFYGYYNGLIDYYNYTFVQPLPVGSYIGYDFRSQTEVYKGMRPKSYATDLLTDEAVNIIKKHNVFSTKPLFLMVNHAAPHTGNDYDPMQAPKKEKAKFNYIKDPDRGSLAAMISKLDKGVGDLVEVLEQKGMLDNTIIMFYSDNGAPTAGYYANHGSNHPFRGQKNSPWEGATRNLGLIYSPLIKKKHRVYNGYFHTTDILPTLASAAGITLGKVDGFSQWNSLVNGGESPRTEIVSTLDSYAGFSSIISDQWKLVNGTTADGFYDGFLGATESFVLCPQAYAYAIQSSSVSKTLARLKSSSPDLDATKINQMRRKLTTNCNAAANPSKCNPLIAPCLFNITADPCEINNLANVYPQELQKLVLRMNNLARTAVPTRRTFVDDPQCDPQLHSGTWTWWVADSV